MTPIAAQTLDALRERYRDKTEYHHTMTGHPDVIRLLDAYEAKCRGYEALQAEHAALVARIRAVKAESTDEQQRDAMAEGYRIWRAAKRETPLSLAIMRVVADASALAALVAEFGQ